MKYSHIGQLLVCLLPVLLTACATGGQPATRQLTWDPDTDFSTRVPQHIETGGEKVVMVDPRVHAWGAYDRHGDLVKAGIASAGSAKCEDEDRSCFTTVGTFHISSLGSPDCYSHIYPKPTGGGLMPYCMFFHGDMSLHGAPDYLLGEANLSHGCVRMRIQDSEWMRYNFAQIGTKVVVRPYS